MQGDWVTGITLGVALLGAVLGVINVAWALWRDRVRIKVVAVWEARRYQRADGVISSVNSAHVGGLEANPDGLFGVRVTNLGLVEVTVTSVGLTRSGFFTRRRPSKLILSAINGDAYQEATIPKRLKSRESLTIWCAYRGDALDDVLRGQRRVFASTDCGLTRFGTSKLLRGLVREASSLGQRLQH